MIFLVLPMLMAGISKNLLADSLTSDCAIKMLFTLSLPFGFYNLESFLFVPQCVQLSPSSRAEQQAQQLFWPIKLVPAGFLQWRESPPPPTHTTDIIVFILHVFFTRWFFAHRTGLSSTFQRWFGCTMTMRNDKVAIWDDTLGVGQSTCDISSASLLHHHFRLSGLTLPFLTRLERSRAGGFIHRD